MFLTLFSTVIAALSVIVVSFAVFWTSAYYGIDD